MITPESPTSPIRPQSPKTAGLLPQPRPIPWWAAYPALLGLYLVFLAPWGMLWPAAPLANSFDPGEFWPFAGRQWTIHAVNSLIVLAVALGAGRWLRLRLSDLGLAPAWPRGPDRRPHARRQAWIVWAWVLGAYLVATVLRAVITVAAPDLVPGLPGQDQADPVAMAVTMLPIAFTTSWIEETLTVALVVVILTAARQHPAVIIAVVALAKVPYHLAYMGPAALPVILPGVVCAWAYLRTRRLTPIIAAHITHNVATSALVLVPAALTAVAG